jgi:hypothetical protein
VRPLLYSPSGDVVAIETTNEDRKDAILIELFGVLVGVPACLDRWHAVGGVRVATNHMVAAIVEVIGKERLEQTWGVTLTEKSGAELAGPGCSNPAHPQTPHRCGSPSIKDKLKTFADVEAGA